MLNSVFENQMVIIHVKIQYLKIKRLFCLHVHVDKIVSYICSTAYNEYKSDIPNQLASMCILYHRSIYSGIKQRNYPE